jgi:hypothetical protein
MKSPRLHRETVRNLSRQELSRAGGGTGASGDSCLCTLDGISANLCEGNISGRICSATAGR